MITINTLHGSTYYTQQDSMEMDGAFKYYAQEQRLDSLEPNGFWYGGLKDRIVNGKDLITVEDFETVYYGKTLNGEHLRKGIKAKEEIQDLQEQKDKLKQTIYAVNKKIKLAKSDKEKSDLTNQRDEKETELKKVVKDMGARAGVDLQVAPPKAVSVLVAHSTPEQRMKIQAAEDRAIKRLMDKIQEQYAYTREAKNIGEKAEPTQTDKLLFGCWKHSTSRPVDMSVIEELVAMGKKEEILRIINKKENQNEKRQNNNRTNRRFSQGRSFEDGSRRTSQDKGMWLNADRNQYMQGVSEFVLDGDREADSMLLPDDREADILQRTEQGEDTGQDFVFTQGMIAKLTELQKQELSALFPQPQEHYHLTIMNTTESQSDHKLKAFYSDVLGNKEHRYMLDNMHNSFVADELRKECINVVMGEDQQFHIVGIDPALEMFYSQRKETIDKAHKESNDPKASKTFIALETREDKNKELTATEFYSKTQAMTKAIGLSPTLNRGYGVELINKVPKPEFSKVIATLTQQNSFFSRTQLESELWRIRTYNPNFDVEATLKEYLSNDETMCLHTRDFNDPVYTTKTLWNQEKKAEEQIKHLNTNRTHNIKNIDEIILKREAELTKKLGKPIKLTEEQRHMVKMTCREDSAGIAVIQASAGTGKSFGAGFTKKAHEASGYQVIGIAPSHAAKEVLSKDMDGMTCYTINRFNIKTQNFEKEQQKYLKLRNILNSNPNISQHKKKRLQQYCKAFEANPITKYMTGEKTCVIADEYGMVDYTQHSKFINTLSEVNDKNKNPSRAILTGDFNQLMPVGRGAAFKRIVEQELVSDMALMTNIARQKTDWQREASERYADAFNTRVSVNQTETDIIIDGNGKQLKDAKFKTEFEAKMFLNKLSQTKENGNTAILLESGKAKYNFDAKEKESFYVKALVKGQEKIFWGKEIEPALRASQAQVGDVIKLEATGKEQVKVYDRKTKQEIITEKNIWSCEVKNNYKAEFRKSEDNTYSIQSIKFDSKQNAESLAVSLGKYYAREQIDKVIKAYDNNGRIDKAFDRKESVNKLVKSYMQDKTAYSEKVALTSMNANVDSINKAIQEERRRTNELGAKGISIHLENKKETFYQGDRVLFTVMDEKTKKKKGQFGTISEIKFAKDNSYSYKVKMDDGTTEHNFTSKDFQTAKEPAPFKLGYATTLNFAQGKTVEKSFVLDDSKFSNYQLFYIALTRHKEDCKIFTTEAEFDTLTQRISNRAEKLNLADLDLKEDTKLILEGLMNEQSKQMDSNIIPAIPELSEQQQKAIDEFEQAYIRKHDLNPSQQAQVQALQQPTQPTQQVNQNNTREVEKLEPKPSIASDLLKLPTLPSLSPSVDCIQIENAVKNIQQQDQKQQQNQNTQSQQEAQKQVEEQQRRSREQQRLKMKQKEQEISRGR